MEILLYCENTKEIVGTLKSKIKITHLKLNLNYIFKILAEIILVNSLNEKQNNSLADIYIYQRDQKNKTFLPVGHRGMGVTFDADSLPKIEYKYLLIFVKVKLRI